MNLRTAMAAGKEHAIASNLRRDARNLASLLLTWFSGVDLF